MVDPDILVRRARDLERYHRNTADRRAKGLCLKCGKQPPTPGRTRCEPCAAKKRAPDRARHHRRTAQRTAQGLCPKCGKQPPAPELSVCAPCAEKSRVAGRARNARLRAAGKPRRDREKARIANRRRYRQQSAERRAQGLCPECGKRPPAPDASACAPCGDRRQAAERARHAKASAAGKPYGGRDPEKRRKLGREKSRRRARKRLEAGLCARCGKHPPVDGGRTCEVCLENRQAAERRRYAAKRAAGRCTRCDAPTFAGEARCGPCAGRENSGRSPEKRNAAARRLYARRRARGACTDCGAPAQGAARCEPCARRSHERSAYFRGMPLYPPQYTVVELDTGEDLGTWDSWEDVALCLAFSRLSLDQVTVVTDQSPVATWAAWE